MVYATIVNREDDSSRGVRKNSVPYPFIYFSENKYAMNDESLRKYLFVIFYKHFLKSLVDLNFRESLLRLKAYSKTIY